LTGISCPLPNLWPPARKGMEYPALDPQTTAIGHLSPNNTQIATGTAGVSLVILGTRIGYALR
jgi:hypothetical protein